MFLLNQTYAPLKTLSDRRALSDLIQMILMMEHILIYYKFWKPFIPLLRKMIAMGGNFYYKENLCGIYLPIRYTPD